MTSQTTRRALLAGAAATTALAALPVQAGKDGKLHKIEIRSFKFSPASLTVKPGDRIRWTNRDDETHDATALDRSWKTKKLRRNNRGEVTVTAGMATDYFCSIHPKMRAKLVISTT